MTTNKCFSCNRDHIGFHWRWLSTLSYFMRCKKCSDIYGIVATLPSDCILCFNTCLMPIPMSEFYG